MLTSLLGRFFSFLSLSTASYLSSFNICKITYFQPDQGKSLSLTCFGQQEFALDKVSLSGLLYSLPEESEKGQRKKLVDLMWTDACSGNRTVKYNLF